MGQSIGTWVEWHKAVLHDGSETLAAIVARLESEDSMHIWPWIWPSSLESLQSDFCDIGIVSPFAEAYNYGADVDDLYHELHQAKRLLQRMKVEDRLYYFVI